MNVGAGLVPVPRLSVMNRFYLQLIRGRDEPLVPTKIIGAEAL
jgi:hypothetical protein